MISPLQAFDVQGMNSAYALGKDIGATNSAYTPLGTALKATLDKYHSSIASQNEQSMKMAQINAQGQNALDVQGLQNTGASTLAQANRAAKMPSKEQAAQLQADYNNPFFATDSNSGAVVVRGSKWDENAGEVLPSWNPIASPDAAKSEKAAILKMVRDRMAARGTKEPSVGGTKTTPFGQAPATASISAQDQALIEQLNAMAAQHRASKQQMGQ